MSGTLYGLGIGPGDPGLITLKARDVLAHVPVIAYPAPEGGASLVREIAAPHVPAGRTEIVIATPMTIDRFPAQEVYDRYAAEIAAHLELGLDVAVLCEGDPLFYGSFMYIHERLAARYRTMVVPGVSSLAAVAAAAGTALVGRNEVLSVVPAPLPDAELVRRIAGSDAAAIIKVGRHLGKVRRVLASLGLERHSTYVERASMANEKLVPLSDLDRDAAPYFSMVLVRKPRPTVGSDVARSERRARLPAGAAVVALGPSGVEAARRLLAILPGSRLHGLAGRVEGADVAFSRTTEHLCGLFRDGVPIVGVCAAGILIRALARLLTDKTREPPVLAVAEDLSVAVPLLGGHHGANEIARAIAAALGAVPAITTAGDVRHGLALDDPPPGWKVANPAAVKPVAAALLTGDPVSLRVEAGDATWLRTSCAVFVDEDNEGGTTVRVSDRLIAQHDKELILHPPVLAVGVGCERGTEPEELIGLVARTLQSEGLATGAVACIASLDLKADEAAIHAVAHGLGVPARFFIAAELEAEASRLATPSDVVYREVGCHGVAEGAALAAAGADAILAVAKRRSRRATCAVARTSGSIDAESVGRPQGRLMVVGIGPGDGAWRSPAATRALREATDVIGYGLYLDLIGDEIRDATRHEFALAQEETRTRAALDMAAAGRPVALVSSGDAGVYGLAALVFELLDREDRPDWNRVTVSVVPGISAFQAAAARLGAPMGHDFCAISLSDLLTPWAEIEQRLKAAAAGDFVVALYNPASRRRRTQLSLARDILLGCRPAETPAALVRNVGREGETIEVVRLDELNPDSADMLTVVLIGCSRTRAIVRGVNRWLYTPRGYENKLVGSRDSGVRSDLSPGSVAAFNP